MNDTKENNDEIREFLQNELIPETERLSLLKKHSMDAFNSRDCGKMKVVVLELLQACFGDDVLPENIRERLDKQIDAMETCLKETSGLPQPGENSVVEYHCLFAQRILAAHIGTLAKRLEKSWLDIWPGTLWGFVQLLGFHDVLLKYRLYLNMIPGLVALRSLKPPFLAEWDSGLFTKNILVDSEAGRATITIDLLQPEENLINAFERFIDQAKSEIKNNTENKRLVNLYDFTRQKDGRRKKPLYSDWHRAIIDFEEASGYASYYQAAQDFAPQKKDGSKGVDTTRKNFENRTKRYYSMLDAVTSDTFPSFD
jgi:hypothetical protein